MPTQLRVLLTTLIGFVPAACFDPMLVLGEDTGSGSDGSTSVPSGSTTASESEGTESQADSTGVTDAPPVITALTVNSSTMPSELQTSGMVIFDVDATDDIGIDHIEIYDGDTLVTTVTEIPYRTELLLTSADNGSHSYSAIAYDAAGPPAESEVVPLSVNIVGGALLELREDIANTYLPVFLGYPRVITDETGDVFVTLTTPPDARQRVHTHAVGYSSTLSLLWESTLDSGTSVFAVAHPIDMLNRYNLVLLALASEPTTACNGTPMPPSFTSYCHGDGRTWGLASDGVPLFEARPSLSDEAIHALFEGFLADYHEAVGLAPGLSPQDLDLVPAQAFRAPAGKLVLLRFDQRYRGIPVYGPDSTVRVTLAPDGVIAFNGAIVDGREVWTNLEQQASEEAARRSILAHAAERSGLPAEDLEVADLHRVAVPATQRIGWVGTVHSGLRNVATIVVDGDPEAGLPLPILHAEHIEAAGLVNEVDIGVLAEHPATDVFTPPDQAAGLGELFDGNPLRGSTRGSDVILGTERVVGYDVSAALGWGTVNTTPPLASTTAAFDAAPGTVAYDVQNHYVRVQSFYSFAHHYMAGVWESLIAASSFLPGEFAPRVMVLTTPGFDICEGASFCTTPITVGGALGQIADEWEQPLGGPNLESVGVITVETDDTAAHTVAHEFGHVVDLFAAPYFIGTGLGCTGAPGCVASCQLDTTEEAPTLTEAVAQLFAIAATSALYPVATSDNCAPLLDISLGDDGVPHNEACRPDGEPYSHFLEEPCPLDAGTCDHDFDVGMENGQPTGLCGPSAGYRTDSLHQAFWEIFHAESCAAEPPYTCTPMALPAGLSASDAFMPALLYALRVDAKSFRQFVDAFATHVSCNLGTDVYEQVNAVLCHHGLRVCEAPPPAICETCHNGVREGAEECDGGDLGGASCVGLGFSGGVVACDSSCMIDSTMCADTGTDTTAGTTGDESTGTDATGADKTGGTAGADAPSGGCSCSTGSGGGAVVTGLLGLVGAWLRRRRAGLVLASALAGGCCDPMVATKGSHGASESSGGTELESTSAGDSESSSPPEWAQGTWVTPYGRVTGVNFWYGLARFDDGELSLEWNGCGENGVQRFRWELADDGQSLALEPVTPADVFAFGNDQVSAVVVESHGPCELTMRATSSSSPKVVTSWTRGETICGAVQGSCTFDLFPCGDEPVACP